jgi:PAS domain S-box-containing protein
MFIALRVRTGIRAKLYHKEGTMSQELTQEELRLEVSSLKQEVLALKQSEKASKIDLAEMKQIFQTVADGVIVIDKNYNVVRVNETFTVLSGFSEKESIGRKCYEIFPGALCHTPGCPMVRISSCAERVEYEVDKQRRNRTKVPCIVTATPLRGPDGELLGIVEDFKDISRLKRIQADLHQSFEKFRKAMGGIIQAISLTIEKRDPHTAGHQRRVAKLSRAIATHMGFSWDRIEGIRMAAAIHDLGKIHVPAAILSRPGQLSEPELSIIRIHPNIGYDILKGIKFSWPIAQTILQHHERMDGSGYPFGLFAEDILEEARILAVADVVEAMSSHRPYRPAHGIDKALEEISKGKGILYDPKVVDVCLNLFLKKNFRLE